MTTPADATPGYGEHPGRAATARYRLRLYVSGTTPRSLQAIEAVRALCDVHLAGRYDIEVIDLYQEPELARDRQIVATPTLVRELPLPVRKLVGDLTRKDRVLAGLDIEVTR